MCRATKNPQSGFTLIELSIVLVIIGLVSAGVLMGRDLIRAANIRAQITQFEKLTAAALAFKLKYNCLPGDCASATALGFGYDGDGDGKLKTINNNFEMMENQNFWYHLSQAELIEGSFLPTSSGNALPPGGQYSPMAKLSGYPLAGIALNVGGLMVTTLDPYKVYAPVAPGHRSFTNISKHAWYISSYPWPHTNFSRIYLAPDMYAMDSKMDDGLPGSGGFTAIDSNTMSDLSTVYSKTQVTSTGGPFPLACIDDTNPAALVYNVRSSSPTDPLSNNRAPLCSPLVQAGF